MDERNISERARALIYRRFALGRKSVWVPGEDVAAADQSALDELLEGGWITRHLRARRTIVEYRGTDATRRTGADQRAHMEVRHAMLLAEAEAVVPRRVEPPPVAKRAARIVEKQNVANPYRDDALVAEQFQLLDAAGIRDRKQALPGFIEAEVNLATMIGGLARVDGVTHPQQLAAAQLRGLYERSMIGAAKAIDYTAVRVDTSGSANSEDVDRGVDARARYAEAVRRLGLTHSAVVLPVVLEDQSLRALARRLGEGQGGAAIERIKKRLLDGVDVLVRHFGYGGTPARRGQIRADGDVPIVFTGFIASRKVRAVA
mgnify:CR=1 FL=1